MLQEEITSRLYDTSQELSNSVWQLDASGTEVKRPWYGQSMGRRGLAGDERQIAYRYKEMKTVSYTDMKTDFTNDYYWLSLRLRRPSTAGCINNNNIVVFTLNASFVFNGTKLIES